VVEVLYRRLRPRLGYAREDYCAVAVGVVKLQPGSVVAGDGVTVLELGSGLVAVDHHTHLLLMMLVILTRHSYRIYLNKQNTYVSLQPTPNTAHNQ